MDFSSLCLTSVFVDFIQIYLVAVSLCLGVRKNMFVPMWRPEEDAGSFSWLLSPLLFEAWLLTQFDLLFWLGWLRSELIGPSPQRCGYRYILPCLAITWRLGL